MIAAKISEVPCAAGTVVGALRAPITEFLNNADCEVWARHVLGPALGRSGGSGPTLHLLAVRSSQSYSELPHNHCSLLFLQKTPIPRL